VEALGGASNASFVLFSSYLVEGAGLMIIEGVVRRSTTRTRRRGSTTTERQVEVKDSLAFHDFSLLTRVFFVHSLLAVLTSRLSAVYSPLSRLLSSPLFFSRLFALSSLLSLRLSVPLFLSSKSEPACSVSSPVHRYEGGDNEKCREHLLDEKLLAHRETEGRRRGSSPRRREAAESIELETTNA
jgi:hypothetical protein